jgi:SAM-dependent methyltransferase
MNTAAASAYHATRKNEGRLLADELVRDLPRSGARTALADEWCVRQRSLQRLLAHLAKTPGPLRVLEIGCGNGWLSARLAEAGHSVTGMDIHSEELEQASRVFADKQITWSLADPLATHLPHNSFDRIVFAASVQYFRDLNVLFAHIRGWLVPDGEIHVLDSVFYADASAAKSAAVRSASYFAQLGTPEMAAYYHHHTLSDLLSLGAARILSSPSRWDWSRFPPKRRMDPFHHTVHTFPRT